MFDRRQAAIGTLWLLTLAVSFLLYRTEHALEHLLWHLVYGGSAGLLVATGWTLHQDVPAPSLLLWAWAGYVYMIIPDLIWLAPRLAGHPAHPHQGWMDLFLGHVFLDTWSWTTPLLVPVLATAAAGYLWAVHHTESSPE